MKKYSSMSLVIIAIAFVSSLFFSSCSKDKYDPVTPSVPLIATSMSYDKDGVLDEMITLQYDKERRLTKMIYNDGSYDLLEYSGSTVTLKNYEDEKLDYVAVAKLNNQGLCISISSDNEYYSSTIEYDINGYRRLSMSESATRIYTERRTITDGNYGIINSENNPKTNKSATLRELDIFPRSGFLNFFRRKYMSKTSLKSTADYNEKTEYQFYTGKTNTIEDENYGVSFNGKQNKNPIKQETRTYYWDGSTTETTTYTYEYDTKGRITKQITDDGSYIVFTYVD